MQYYTYIQVPNSAVSSETCLFHRAVIISGKVSKCKDPEIISSKGYEIASKCKGPDMR